MNPNYCVFQNVTLSVGPGGSGYYSQHAANEADAWLVNWDSLSVIQSGTYWVRKIPKRAKKTSSASSVPTTATTARRWRWNRRRRRKRRRADARFVPPIR